MPGIPASDERRIILPLDTRFNANINQIIYLDLIGNRCDFGMILKLRKELLDYKLKTKNLQNGIILIFMIVALFLTIYILIKENILHMVISLLLFLILMSISICQAIRNTKHLISKEWMIDKANKDFNNQGVIVVYNRNDWCEIWKTESYGLYEMQNILNGTCKVLSEIDPIWSDIKESFLQVADYYLLAGISGYEPLSSTSISSSTSSLSPVNSSQRITADTDYYYNDNDIEDPSIRNMDIDQPLLSAYI